MVVGVEGLTHFHEVLCDVRAKYLDSLSVPKVCDWTITQCHFGRDSKSSIAGLDFEVTFLDWFGNLVRIYAKGAAGNKVRMERIETPNKTVASILDSAEGTIKKMMGEPTTCVADDLRTIRADFAWKMSAESLVSDALGTNTFFQTQSLHV